MTDFTAVNARARGLSTHLLTRSQLATLVSLEPDELATALRGQAAVRFPSEAPLAKLDEALRDTLERQLAILGRWNGARPVLEVFFAELDRHSLRALVRGARGAAPAAARLTGVIATPTLPLRVLDELSRAPTPATVVRALVTISHPDSESLSALVTEKAHPDLFALDHALLVGFAKRATAAAKMGDEVLRGYVEARLDVCNLTTALLLATAPTVDAAAAFIEGGGSIDRARFEALVAAKGQVIAVRRALASTPLPTLVDSELVDGAAIERRFLHHTLSRLRAVAREQPLSCAPTLRHLLSLEAMARDLRRVVWGSLQHAPTALVEPGLVTP